MYGEAVSVNFLLKIECVGVFAVLKMFSFKECAMPQERQLDSRDDCWVDRWDFDG